MLEEKIRALEQQIRVPPPAVTIQKKEEEEVDYSSQFTNNAINRLQEQLNALKQQQLQKSYTSPPTINVVNSSKYGQQPISSDYYHNSNDGRNILLKNVVYCYF